MKCAGGGDSKYELSGSLLVHVIKMSAFKSAMKANCGFLAQKHNPP